ncbi:MAG: hypothetical protein ACYC1M_09690 [Armatimonadota bacterium]
MKDDPIRPLTTDDRFTVLNGKRTLLVGDSVTHGWMDLGTNYDWKAYLSMLAKNGCNVVMLWSYIGLGDQVKDARVGYNAPELWPWTKTGHLFDLASLNDRYFTRLRDFVHTAKMKGIVVILTVHDGWTKTLFSGHPFNSALGGPLHRRDQYIELYDYRNEMPAQYNTQWTWQQKNQYYQERFCHRLIEATAKYGHVIYEMFNEGEWYDQAKLDLYQAHFLSFFKKRTTSPTMVNERPKLKASPDCGIYSLHKPNWDANTNAVDSYRLFVDEHNNGVSKPLFFSEPVPEYQGSVNMNLGLMRLMWGTVLAGAGFVVQNDCSFGFDKRAAISRKCRQRDTIYTLEGHCARLLCSVNVGEMIPQGELASSGVCLANPSREYLVYTQSNTVKVNLEGTSSQAAYRLYDPEIGKASPWRPCDTRRPVVIDTGSQRDRVVQIRAV